MDKFFVLLRFEVMGADAFGSRVEGEGEREMF